MVPERRAGREDRAPDGLDGGDTCPRRARIDPPHRAPRGDPDHGAGRARRGEETRAPARRKPARSSRAGGRDRDEGPGRGHEARGHVGTARSGAALDRGRHEEEARVAREGREAPFQGHGARRRRRLPLRLALHRDGVRRGVRCRSGGPRARRPRQAHPRRRRPHRARVPHSLRGDFAAPAAPRVQGHDGKLAIGDARLSQAIAFAGAAFLTSLLLQGLFGGAKGGDPIVSKVPRRQGK